MTNVFVIGESDGKGLGAFARKPISMGSVIMQEPKILEIQKPIAEVTDDDVKSAFDRLGPLHQHEVLQLHKGNKSIYETRLLRILHSNGFGDDGRSWLYIARSRINHSCVPNASAREHCVIAERNIAPGEEICISYADDIYESLTARQRNVLLNRTYGFECSCEACLPSIYNELSDTRRSLIAFIKSALAGIQPPNTSPLDKRHSDVEAWRIQWPPSPVRLKKQLAFTQRVEYAFLLANLRQAEGQSAFNVAFSLSRAAHYLLEYLNEHALDERVGDIMPLEAGRYIRAWMLKALRLMESVSPPNDKDLSILRLDWKAMERFTPVRLSKLFPPEAFALLLESETPTAPAKMLSRAETERIIRKRLGRM